MTSGLFTMALTVGVLSATQVFAQTDDIWIGDEEGEMNFVYGNDCERLAHMSPIAIEHLISSRPRNLAVFCKVRDLQDCADYVTYVLDYGYLLPRSDDESACRFLPEGTLLDEIGTRDTFNF